MANTNSIIEKIKTKLATISWLEKNYGRAYLHSEMRDKKVVKLPKCFDNGDYVNVLPNDNFKAISFIAAKGPEKLDDFSKDGNNVKSRELSVIVWGNLKKINPEKSGIYSSDIKKEIEILLCGISEIVSINQVFDEKAEDIFQGYTLDDVKTQYLMYPYVGLRFDITVKYFENVCE